MQLYSINAGYFKLDGGAMFGVVPKSIWNKLNPADENNMCSWAMRCLLIEAGNRLILVDNGMGDKQDARFFGHYYLHGTDTLSSSLAAHGFHANDITDVVLTHLHFDHCGGSILRNGTQLLPAFPNARYWSTPAHWQWATHPNDREKASFLPENILPIEQTGQLHFVSAGPEAALHRNPVAQPIASGIIPELRFLFAHGHTDAMMLPVIDTPKGTLVFMADLLPSVAHLPLPYVMGYDMFPLTTLQEKKHFLQQALQENWTLFFEHDPVHACCNLKLTEKGIRQQECFSLANWLA